MPGGRACKLGKNALNWGLCVLRDAPRRCRVALSNEGVLLMALRKIPHPEASREARPRRTHDVLAQWLVTSSTRSLPI
jgi:hypothetical protein